VLGLAYLMPDCWLEVSLHLEGPATGQLDQDKIFVKTTCKCFQRKGKEKET
jgi:hypothetical protein